MRFRCCLEQKVPSPCLGLRSLLQTEGKVGAIDLIDAKFGRVYVDYQLMSYCTFVYDSVTGKELCRINAPTASQGVCFVEISC